MQPQTPAFAGVTNNGVIMSQQLAEQVLRLCRAKGMKIATAESCTGGMVAAALTDIPGSSDVFERGFITYSNAAKMEMLGVSASLIEKRGAVSEEVARAMAEGVLRHSPADISVAITGIAGPGGGTAEKPVGLVHIAAVRRCGETTHLMKTAHRKFHFPGTREEVRRQSVEAALEMLFASL